MSFLMGKMKALGLGLDLAALETENIAIKNKKIRL